MDALLLESSRLMKEGIRVRDEAPARALECFDRARELRQRLPIDAVPAFRYDLAACWLNRAEALILLGTDASEARQAVDAYDEALVLLRTLPLDEDPRFVRRLALACQNRGRLLPPREAVVAFVEAISVLERHGARVADRQRLLATCWMNAANAWMADDDEQSAIQAGRAARLAIALVEPAEQDEADAAEIGLNARHVLCRLLAATALAVTPPTAVPSDDIHDATDLADDALALVAHWERRGSTRFRALACDFFRFGAHVYAAHQPRFLPEFIQDHLDPARSSPEYVESPEMRLAAREAAALQPVTYYVTLAVSRS